MIRIQDTRSHYRKRIRRARQPKNGNPRSPKEVKGVNVNQRAPIKRAKSCTMAPFQIKKKRKVEKATKTAIKSRRDSVGTTKKPTSTNRKEMMLKVRRTGISKREETGTEIRRAMPKEVLAGMRRGQEESTSKTPSKMTKSDRREETQEDRVPTSR